MLHDYSTKLVIRGVHIDMEGKVMVGIPKEGIMCEHGLGLFESTLTLRGPNEGLVTRNGCEGSKNMRSLRIHVAIEIDHANEGTKFFHGFWRS